MEQKVVQEIYETERSYIRDLLLLIKVYKNPLLTSGLIPPEMVDQIFLNVEEILAFHKLLFREMGQLTADLRCIIKCLKEQASNFKMYSEFCDGSDAGLHIWSREVKRDKRLRSWEEENTQAGPTKGHSLKDFLIKPIQRLCKYPLLLKNLVEVLPPGSQEHKDAEEAYNSFQTVLTSINKKKDALASLQVLIQLTRRIQELPGTLIKGNRKFIRESRVRVYTDKDLTSAANDAEPHVLLLFSDIILLCREEKKREKLTFHHEITFNSGFLIGSIPGSNFDNAFLIEIRGADTNTSFIIFCSKPSEKRLLYSGIEQLSKEVASSTTVEEKGAIPDEVLRVLSEKLIAAVQANQVDAVKSLVGHGAIQKFVNYADPTSKRCPLFYAAREGFADIVLLLLNATGIDFNQPAIESKATPLHAASFGDRPICVALLIAAGADCSLRNSHGLSPKQEARGAALDVYMIFQSHGVAGLMKTFPIVLGLKCHAIPPLVLAKGTAQGKGIGGSRERALAVSPRRVSGPVVISPISPGRATKALQMETGSPRGSGKLKKRNALEEGGPGSLPDEARWTPDHGNNNTESPRPLSPPGLSRPVAALPTRPDLPTPPGRPFSIGLHTNEALKGTNNTALGAMITNINNEDKTYQDIETSMFVKKKTVPDLQQLIVEMPAAPVSPVAPPTFVTASPPRARLEKTPIRRESTDVFFNFEAEFEGLEISQLVDELLAEKEAQMVQLPELPRQQNLDPDLVEAFDLKIDEKVPAFFNTMLRKELRQSVVYADQIRNAFAGEPSSPPAIAEALPRPSRYKPLPLEEAFTDIGETGNKHVREVLKRKLTVDLTINQEKRKISGQIEHTEANFRQIMKEHVELIDVNSELIKSNHEMTLQVIAMQDKIQKLKNEKLEMKRRIEELEESNQQYLIKMASGQKRRKQVFADSFEFIDPDPEPTKVASPSTSPRPVHTWIIDQSN